MTRTATVNDFKGGRKVVHGNAGPREGTRAADLYHALRRGEVVFHADPAALQHLQLYYGVETKGNPGHRGGGGGIWLLGEWDGPIYLTLEQVMAQEQARDLESIDAEQAA